MMLARASFSGENVYISDPAMKETRLREEDEDKSRSTIALGSPTTTERILA